MEKREFMRPKLVGRRFDQHTIPLELLKDFSALEEMIVEVAKRHYLTDNPNRKRTPKGFSNGIQLHFSAIEEGSAIAVLTCVFATLLPPHENDYLAKARDSIASAISAVERDQKPDIAPELLRYFDRIGRGLRDGESIEFTTKEKEIATLTLATRDKLLRASQASEWTKEAVLKGCVCEIDEADSTFEIQLLDGTKLKAPLLEQFRTAVHSALSGYKAKQLVTLQGIAKTDTYGRLQRIESIEHITLLDELDVETRMEELAKLKDGWLDGAGIGFDSDTLKLLARDFDLNFDGELPLPHLYPTPDGGIQAEWSATPWDITLEINLENRNCALHALDLNSQKTIEKAFVLNADVGWKELNLELQKLIGSSV